MTGIPNPNDSYSYKSVGVLSVRLIGTNPTGGGSDNSSAWLDFTLSSGETVFIVTAVGGGGKTYDFQNRLTGEEPMGETAALL